MVARLSDVVATDINIMTEMPTDAKIVAKAQLIIKSMLHRQHTTDTQPQDTHLVNIALLMDTLVKLQLVPVHMLMRAYHAKRVRPAMAMVTTHHAVIKKTQPAVIQPAVFKYLMAHAVGRRPVSTQKNAPNGAFFYNLARISSTS